MYILDDDSIVVHGLSYNYYHHISPDFFTVVFDQDGELQWSLLTDNNNSHWTSCDSDFIYTNSNGQLKKHDSQGRVLWSKDCESGLPVGIANEVLYLVSFAGTSMCTSLDISARNTITGTERWSSNFRICNNNSEVYNSSLYDSALAEDASLMILIQARELATWYLQTINQDGVLTSHTNLLNHCWVYSQIDMGIDESLVHVAGYNYDYGLSVAVFDVAQLESFSIPATGGLSGFTLSDQQLIGIVAVGVVVFDILLIIILWKKYE
jgi:hypothetical protein